MQQRFRLNKIFKQKRNIKNSSIEKVKYSKNGTTVADMPNTIELFRIQTGRQNA